MKVDAIQTNYRGKLYNQSVNSKKNDNTINNSPRQILELPGYKLISANRLIQPITFSGEFEKKSIAEMNKEYLKQIEDAEKELNVLRNPSSNPKVDQAIEENNFCDDFVRNRAHYYATAHENAVNRVNSWDNATNWWYRLWKGSERDKIWEGAMKPFTTKEDRYDAISGKYNLNKALIESANKSEDERIKRIAELEALIISLKKLIDYGNLQNVIDDMLNGTGGLEERIAGYQRTKDEIRKFIENIQKADTNPGGYVQPCVILYGATGTGKTTFLKSVESMTKDQVSVIRFKDNDKESFITSFKKAVKDAKKRYMEEGKRTILLMDDAEKYFCMPESEAMQFYANELDNDDLDKIRLINNTGSNQGAKNFKYILDELALPPEEDDSDSSYKSAMSIFITTNHPNIIDRQLIKRPEKMDAYYVGPAEKQDLNDVVKYYFNDKVQIINALKMFEDRSDREAAINGISGLTQEAKDSILRHFKEHKADLLNIDPEDVDYDALTEDIQPDETNGAYSNVMIKKIAFNAFERYLEDPENSFVQYFYDELENTDRDIEPQRYKRYLETANYVNMFKKKKALNFDDKIEFLKALKAKNNKLLKKENLQMLDSYIQDFKVRLQTLQDKEIEGKLSENETRELENLTDLNAYVENPKLVKQTLDEMKKR